MIRIYFFYANTIGILGLGGLVILADYWRKPMPNQINSVFIARGETKKQLQSQD
jgi:hypothetical protein